MTVELQACGLYPERRGTSRGRALALALLPMLLVLGLRLAAPEDMDNNDQAKQALYVLDIWQRGHWILPIEQDRPATKPPLYAWLATAASRALGEPSELSCRIPSMLAFAALTCLIFVFGAERFGHAVGVAAAWFFAVSHTAIDLAIQIRPDMVMSLLVALCFFALHRAEQGRAQGMPRLFWAALSLGCLTKGPVALLVVGAPALLLALRRDARPWLRQIVASPWAALLALPLAWAAGALAQGGESYLRETVFPETVDRVLGTGRYEGRTRVPGYLLGRFLVDFAPWSPLALLGLWEGLRGRFAPERLRLLAYWLGAGLVIFNLSNGQRPDYLLPLLPAAALLGAAVLFAERPGALIVWRALCGAFGVAALVGAVAPLGSVALGPGWRSALGAAAALLLAYAAGARDAQRALGAGALAAPLAALLALHATYHERLSPIARAARSGDVAEFARGVDALRAGGGSLVLFGAIPSSLRVLLRANQPSLSEAELAADLARDAAPRWVVTSGDVEPRVQALASRPLAVRLRAAIGASEPSELLLLEQGGAR